MRVPVKWLSEYVTLNLPVADIAHRLTMAGLEVTGIERTGEEWDGVVVGHVLDVKKHPDADRLSLVSVDVGDETFEVVCGAPNVARGQNIAYAKLGARLFFSDGAHTGEKKKLKKAKIRGVVSTGMVCSERELGLSDEHEGILVLSESTEKGQPLADVFGDTVLDIDMKPNRADGLSVLGVARDVAALTGESLREPDLSFEAFGGAIDGRASVEIQDPDLCSRFTLAIIENIGIGPSPAWMQEALLGAGMRPISNVVDITNYVMLELGQPIHAFDYDKIAEHKIIVRRARRGETLTTLDGRERSFTSEQLLITDPSGAIAVAGVMGGLETEVSDETKTILLEVANFNPVSIRRTAMSLKLPSEASRRFAWGIAPELAPITSRRATKFLVELAGGKASEGLVDAYPRPSQPVTVSLKKKRIPQVLGIDPPEEKVVSSLEALGFGVVCGNGGFDVEVPYWRRDGRWQDDVVEEVARMVGYETIPAEPLAGRVPPGIPQPVRELRERIRDVLVGAGMQEVITYPLTSMEVLARVVAPETLEHVQPLAVVNPLNVGEERMRTSLRASMLACVARNLRVTKGHLAFFEAARVYTPTKDALPRESEHVVGAVTGARLDRFGNTTDAHVDFFDAKAYVERLFDRLSVSASFGATEQYGLLSGRTAEIRVADTPVGVVGQVHPKTAQTFGLGQDVYLLEVTLDELVPHVPPVAHYRPFSKYPAVVEDLAVVVDREQTAATVLAEIALHPLVANARVFDEYTGEQVPEGKKSLAFAVSYQAPDRTLTDVDVAKAREKIVSRLRARCGAELRS
ncbi:MAG: phenylalanine--tRNA ligase subunit beta [Acidobacteriota bacterium]|nr:MAG: phenylalanine--tRNA ligase subunit beta [Acidobacteriota bacterium]